MSDHKVLSWPPGENPVRLCTVPGCPSGIGWTRSGNLLVVSMEDRRVLRLGPSGLVEHADLSRMAPWHLNDMVTDSLGGAYVGNLGWDDERDDEIHETILIYVGLNGAPKVVADGLVNPNGMALSADGHTLLVNETFAARTTAFDVAPDGSLRNRRVWADYAGENFSRVSEALASGAILPDGIALDRDGAAWIGDCRGSGAVRVAEGGEVLDFVSTGEHAAFAVALGSDDGRTLYICTAPAYGRERADSRRRGHVQRPSRGPGGRALKIGNREIKRVGLGTNRLTNSAENRAFLRDAVAAGLDHIDTAHLYTSGESERTIGEALAPLPDHVVVATKGGWNGGGLDRLRAEIDQSLESLRTDSIDLFYLHRPDPATPLEDSLGLLAEMRDAGKVQNVGISNVSLGEIERARQVVEIAAVQNEFNLGEDADDEVVDFCAAEGITFVPFYPLHGESKALEEIASAHGASADQVKIAWLLKRSPAMAPIPGTLSLSHLRENLEALEIKLSNDEFEHLSP